MDRISEVLPKVLNRLEKEVHADLGRVQMAWDGLVGAELAQWSRPVWMGKGELLVEVDSSPVMDRIRYRSADIVKGLNATLKSSLVSSIRFRLGG